jgi:hypothetical protein
VNESTLGAAITEILTDDEKRRNMGLAAVRAVEAKKGIAARCVDAMLRRNLLPRV